MISPVWRQAGTKSGAHDNDQQETLCSPLACYSAKIPCYSQMPCNHPIHPPLPRLSFPTAVFTVMLICSIKKPQFPPNTAFIEPCLSSLATAALRLVHYPSPNLVLPVLR